MMTTQLLLLGDASNELIETLEQNGAIQWSQSPPVYLNRTPNLDQYKLNILLSPEHTSNVNTSLKSSFICTSDASEFPCHELMIVSIALQLVKPTRKFCKYFIKVDNNDDIQQVSRDLQYFYGAVISDPYLRYQQHHTITTSDVERARQLVPKLLQILEQGHGSWVHPFGSIHRAVIFFAQGYSAGLDNLRQVLWAAGLDCLFSSKLKKSLRGAKEISRRFQKLFGLGFNPYNADTVQVPSNQQRPQLRLHCMGKHILWLRNAYMHGLPLKTHWLSQAGEPEESGYAYQLYECTEILLRTTLLKILEDSALLETFKDPDKLDDYFRH